MRIFRFVYCPLLVAFLPNAHACEVGHPILNQACRVTEYQAPMLNCELDNVLPDQYIIYLVPDYNIEEHREKVGSAVQDSQVRFISNFLVNDGVCYSARLNDEQVRIVRGDEGVDLVECNTFVEADDIENSEELPVLPMNHGKAYQATMLNCDSKDVAKDLYYIYLVSGITMEQHKEKVRKALEESQIRVVFDRLVQDKIFYSARLNSEQLAIIRGDHDVELVECITYFHASDDVDSQ